MRKLLLIAIAALVLGGCSAPCTLIVQNNTDDAFLVTLAQDGWMVEQTDIAPNGTVEFIVDAGEYHVWAINEDRTMSNRVEARSFFTITMFINERVEG